MTEIKNAATIILIRNRDGRKFVLMGRRMSTVTFMPSKYVFPGGAWEAQDGEVPFAKAMNNREQEFLRLETEFLGATNLGITAIRELWEETGLRLSCQGKFDNVPSGWEEFFSGGQVVFMFAPGNCLALSANP